jgi:3-methyladenine DNA glycosylase Tag
MNRGATIEDLVALNKVTPNAYRKILALHAAIRHNDKIHLTKQNTSAEQVVSDAETFEAYIRGVNE